MNSSARTTLLHQWMPRLGGQPRARIRLYCFAHAGGGASVYYAWNNLLPDWVELCPIQLPGREERLDEPCVASMSELVDVLAPLIFESLDRPFCLYGHSMGACLGFEIAKRLKIDCGKEALHLFVGAHRSPDQPYPHPSVNGVSKAELLRVLSRFNGLPQAVLDNAELMEVLFPILRADLLVCESYRYRADSTLQAPITVFNGRFDRNVMDADLNGWQQQTDGVCNIVPLNGDHFFLKTHSDVVLKTILQAIDA